MYWRRLNSATALAIAALAIATPTAKAGPYVVQGCNGWAPLDTAPGYVAVYHACPGFVVRNVYGNFSSPGGAQAGWAFGAPAGTLITGVTLAGVMKGYDGWQAAAWVEGGHTPGGALQLQACPWSTCIGAETALGGFGVPAAAVIRLRVRCGTGCSNRNQSGGIFINSPSVTVDDVTPPGAAITGGSILGGWRTGVHSISADAQDNTGIQALRAYVDGLVRTEQPRPVATGAP